jgi:hypothetical protein
MGPQPRHRRRPPLGAPSGVAQVDERLPGEERPFHVMHGPFHPGLVLGGTDPGRVNGEPSGLGVLHERLIQPRLERTGLVHNRRHVVRDQRAEHAPEKLPRRLATLDRRRRGLLKGKPHETMPAITSRENKGLAHPGPARHRVEHQPQPTVINLQLVTRLTIRDPHRDRPAPATPAGLGHIPLHRPLRDRHTPTDKQLMDLHRRQPLLYPPLDLPVIRHQTPPRLTVPVDPMRTHRLEHRP